MLFFENLWEYWFIDLLCKVRKSNFVVLCPSCPGCFQAMQELVAMRALLCGRKDPGLPPADLSSLPVYKKAQCPWTLCKSGKLGCLQMRSACVNGTQLSLVLGLERRRFRKSCAVWNLGSVAGSHACLPLDGAVLREQYASPVLT